ncbi:MAG: hypothetical protein KF855_10820 [Acidobacteria bacterium]|nr:hypothetical protein [Acidobacteriota bacterium]
MKLLQQKQAMKYWKTIFAIIYTFLYAAAAFLAVGFGKGTGIFLSPLIAYFGLSWVVLLAALYLSTSVATKKARLWFIGLMFAHYVTFLAFMLLSWQGNLKGTIYVWENQRSVIWVNVGIYFIGQAIIWLTYILTLRKHRTSVLP